MKKLILLFAGLFMMSCSSTATDVASFEFNGAWYNVLNYKAGTSEAELKEYVKTYSNPNATSYFFFYPEGKDVSVFKKEAFNQRNFAATIADNKPDFGFYRMMPIDPEIHDDAVWLMERAAK